MSRYVFASPRPFAHQREGLKALMANHGRYALLWEPGAGKTRPVIDYAGCLATAGQREIRVLVVCPKAVQDSWVTQATAYLGPQIGLRAVVLQGSIAEKCKALPTVSTAALSKLSEVFAARRIEGPAKVVIAVLNLEALSRSRHAAKGYRSKTNADLFAKAVEQYEPDLLVVDESHRIKSPTSNVSKMLRKLSGLVSRCVLLTGTPMPHGPLDVWAQWQLIDPDAFSTAGRRWTYSVFRERYAKLGGYYGKQVVGFQNLEDLQDRMARRSMALSKADCLDLPPTMTIEHPVHLSAAEMNAYNAMKRDLLVQLGTLTTTSASNRLTQLLRLRQITCGFLKDDQTGAVQHIGTSRQDLAVSLLEDLMASERRVVVFAWSREEVDSLVARLVREAPYGAAAFGITGDTPDARRIELRRRFGDERSDERMILVCQIRTVSLGINELVTASHALFLSLSQQRDDLVQAYGRLDRQGQKKPVTFHHLMAPNTVDELVLRAHQQRTNLEAALLDHIRSS
jgi:SNF2 family DNA or RNA helicase